MAEKKDVDEAQELLVRGVGTIFKGVFGMISSLVTKKSSFTDEYYDMVANSEDVAADIEDYKARLADDFDEGYESAKGMSDAQLRREMQKVAKAGKFARAKGMRTQYVERHQKKTDNN